MSDLPQQRRIIRKHNPPTYYAAHRQYFDYLMEDFEGRCAYSMVHNSRHGGPIAMHIDHHNPHLTHPLKNRYENLLPASAHCNGKKSDNWPTKEQRDAGMRFLNPCSEVDYGDKIFEDPETFRVWGTDAAARYHIRILALNAAHLIDERKKRFHLRNMCSAPGFLTLTGRPIIDDAISYMGIKALNDEIKMMIPSIPQRKEPKPTPTPPSPTID